MFSFEDVLGVESAARMAAEQARKTPAAAAGDRTAQTGLEDPGHQHVSPPDGGHGGQVDAAIAGQSGSLDQTKEPSYVDRPGNGTAAHAHEGAVEVKEEENRSGDLEDEKAGSGFINSIPAPVLNYSRKTVMLPSSPPKEERTYRQNDLLFTILQGEHGELLQEYRSACAMGDLVTALQAVEEAREAGALQILSAMKQKDFLRVAGRRGMVAEAFRFVQLLPLDITDSRTYNMLMSVCAENADLPNALKAASVMQAAGLKLDVKHYTNLIRTAAAAQNAEEAFLLYGEMTKDGVKPCQMVITTLIDACTREMVGMPKNVRGGRDRRRKLVLMERAYQVFADGMAARVQVDVPMWNALINVAAHAGQLDRAFEVLESMQAQGGRPNDITYMTLITACRMAQRPELAMKVYQKAKRDGVTNSLKVYTSAVDACLAADHVALEAAQEIYSDMQLHDIAPSTQLFASLIKVAGRAGALDVAMSLKNDMEFERIDMDDTASAALINACLKCGDWQGAKKVYLEMKILPGQHRPQSYNVMINAHAEAARLGDVLAVVEDMRRGDVLPDKYTFGALIKACQYTSQGELGFEVFSIMKKVGIKLDEATAFTLIRICFNQLRLLWRPGGYPPAHESSEFTDYQNVIALDLLKALGCSEKRLAKWAERQRSTSSQEEWQRRAISVYKESLSNEHGIAIRTLDRMLSCLRMPLGDKLQGQDSMFPLQMDAYGGKLAQQGRELRAPPNSAFGLQYSAITAAKMEEGDDGSSRDKKKLRPVEISFDSRAVILVEEAIAAGALPHYGLDRDDGCRVDMRTLPPSVAEVYVLSMFRSFERRGSPRFSYGGSITFLVPPFNPKRVFSVSNPSGDRTNHGEEGNEEQVADDDSVYEFEDEGGDFLKADASPMETDRTALAVAGQLRRLKIYNKARGKEGVVTVTAREITRWVRTRIRATMMANREATYHNEQAGPGAGWDSSPPQHGRPRGPGWEPLGAQQRSIRNRS